VTKTTFGKTITALFAGLFLSYMVAHAFAPGLPLFATVTPLRFFVGFFAIWALAFLLLLKLGCMAWATDE
jgi:hypothetical protein